MFSSTPASMSSSASAFGSPLSLGPPVGYPSPFSTPATSSSPASAFGSPLSFGPPIGFPSPFSTPATSSSLFTCASTGGGVVPSSVQSNDFKNLFATTDSTVPNPITPSVSSNLFPVTVTPPSIGQHSFPNPAPPSVPSNPFAAALTTPSIGQSPFLNPVHLSDPTVYRGPVPPSVPSSPFATTVTPPTIGQCSFMNHVKPNLDSVLVKMEEWEKSTQLICKDVKCVQEDMKSWIERERSLEMATPQTINQLREELARVTRSKEAIIAEYLASPDFTKRLDEEHEKRLSKIFSAASMSSSASAFGSPLSFGPPIGFPSPFSTPATSSSLFTCASTGYNPFSQTIATNTSRSPGTGFGFATASGQATMPWGSTLSGDQIPYRQVKAPIFGPSESEKFSLGVNQGSRVTSYTKTTEFDDRGEGKMLVSISAMPAYSDKSHEELRWEDLHQFNAAGGGVVPVFARNRSTGLSLIFPSVPSSPFATTVTTPSIIQYSFLNPGPLSNPTVYRGPVPPSVPSNPFATTVTTPSIGQSPFLNPVPLSDPTVYRGPVPPSVPSNPFANLFAMNHVKPNLESVLDKMEEWEKSTQLICKDVKCVQEDMKSWIKRDRSVELEKMEATQTINQLREELAHVTRSKEAIIAEYLASPDFTKRLDEEHEKRLSKIIHPCYVKALGEVQTKFYSSITLKPL